METNRWALVAVAKGSLYLEAEEEAAELRHLIQRRRARMRWRRMARLCQLPSLIFLNVSGQIVTKPFTQVKNVNGNSNNLSKCLTSFKWPIPQANS